MDYRQEIRVSIEPCHDNSPIAAYVTAEYHSDILEEESVVVVIPMRRRDLESIRTAARHTARKTQEPVVLVEQRLCEQYERAIVEEAYESVARQKVEEARLAEQYGTPWD